MHKFSLIFTAKTTVKIYMMETQNKSCALCSPHNLIPDRIPRLFMVYNTHIEVPKHSVMDTIFNPEHCQAQIDNHLQLRVAFEHLGNYACILIILHSALGLKGPPPWGLRPPGASMTLIYSYSYQLRAAL